VLKSVANVLVELTCCGTDAHGGSCTHPKGTKPHKVTCG